VNIDKDQLPDQVVFDAYGSGAPLEEQQKLQQKLAALSEAIQMDQVGIAQGQPPQLDLRSIIEERLRSGGWADTDPFFKDNQGEGQTAPPVSLQAIAGIGNAA